jgi:hypothetical protein
MIGRLCHSLGRGRYMVLKPGLCQFHSKLVSLHLAAGHLSYIDLVNQRKVLLS